MTECTSRYTVNRRTGERLQCTGDADREGHGELRWPHMAEAYGLRWYWKTVEEDRP